jgi:type III secretion protein N (ATPase)
MTRGRIIPGEIVDAEAAARAIRAQAAADADALLAAARHQVEVASDRAGAGAPPERAAAGDVRDVVGLLVRAQIPDATLGEVVTLERAGRSPLPAEVVGFQGELATLLPLGDIAGLAPRAPVRRTGRPLEVTCGEALLGRVLDGLGAPIDGGPPLVGEAWAVDRAAPAPLQRPRATAPLATGVRVVDGLCPLAAGQRVGLFASPGVGKSTLLGQLARGADADVIVTCQVGERGRELGELLATHLAPRRARTIAVCATSDAPSLVRARALATATAIAEWFRDRRGHRVLLVMDSLTRVARAQREVGLAAGEPGVRRGLPPSVFALLPRLLERAGPGRGGHHHGAVHGAGGGRRPRRAHRRRGARAARRARGARPGLAARGRYPPVDVLASVSRVMDAVVDEGHRAAAQRVRALLAAYEARRDLIALGAYRAAATAASTPRSRRGLRSTPSRGRPRRRSRPGTPPWRRWRRWRRGPRRLRSEASASR